MAVLELLRGNIPCLLCLLIGTALVIFEMMLPGFSIPGISGVILIIVGLFISGGTTSEILFLAGCVVLILLLALPICLKALSKGPMGNKGMVLDSVSVENVEAAERKNSQKNYSQDIVGKTGMAVTELRPSGIMLLGDHKYSVISNGEFLKRGTDVRVVSVEGNRIIVESAPVPSNRISRS